MSLNVSFKDYIGHCTLTEKRGDETVKFKVHICHANCLCALINFYKDEKGEEMAQLICWFNDIQHMKNCIKQGILDGFSNFHFHPRQMNAEVWKMVKVLADMGLKITIK